MSKVLVVDDIDSNLHAMQAVLARPGLDVLLARSGAQALDTLLREDVAVAMIDVQMPGMDGFELADLIRGRTQTRELPIIFTTASTDDAGRTMRGYTSGAVDFLHRPIDPDILCRKVDAFVRLSRQRVQLAEQLEASTRLLRLHETFVAALGHDLRNPLQSILVNAALVLRGGGNEPQLEAARRIRGSAQRMDRMIDQLLDVARARTGELALHPAEGDLHALVRAAIDEHDPQGASAALPCTAHGDCRGCWDLDRIAQVIGNLLSNALRHGTHGTPVRVTVDGREAASLRLTVHNDGTIPAAVLPTLFEPFRRAPAVDRSADTERDGLGLGLFIVRHLVSLHGGTVRIDSTARAGTLVTVTLPRDAAAPRAEPDGAPG